MQLIDKDLLSMQEVRELVEAAKEAQQELARMDQAQVDRIVPLPTRVCATPAGWPRWPTRIPASASWTTR